MILKITQREIAKRRRMARDIRTNEYKHCRESHILSDQLTLFRPCWIDVVRDVPYYRRLAETRSVPLDISSWEEFCATVPITEKTDVQREGKMFWNRIRKPDFFRTTGGSTAEPVQLPAWRSEAAQTEANEWMARQWYSIDPEDSSFRIWGHSHILGRGLRGKFNAVVRNVKDSVLQISRISAYNLSEEALHRAWLRLADDHHDYAVGYSGALDSMARVPNNITLRRPLKAVIATGEGFPRSDSDTVISRAFCCPVASEYGCMEAGAIAHTHPDKPGFHVFWRSYFIEALESGQAGVYRILVTSLYPRCFPLIRYDLGDLIEASEPSIGITSFKQVLGRNNSFIELPTGERIHSMALSSAVKDLASVLGYQLINDSTKLELLVRPSPTFQDSDLKLIHTRLCKLHPSLERIRVVQTNRFYKTRAGKTPAVITDCTGFTLD
jgi:phenylacetate-CoA ligase